jgi:hypothetical protein
VTTLGWKASLDEERYSSMALVTHPVILATQEAEITGSWSEAIPRQIVCETLSQKYSTPQRADGVAHLPT